MVIKLYRSGSSNNFFGGPGREFSLRYGHSRGIIVREICSRQMPPFLEAGGIFFLTKWGNPSTQFKSKR